MLAQVVRARDPLLPLSAVDIRADASRNGNYTHHEQQQP
jgi:hypothetical protein